MNPFMKNRALYPVLASLCGLVPESHNRDFYVGECKPGSGLSRKMLSFDNLSRIGSEKGDRAEIERINGGTYALPIGQPTIISRDLPVGDPWLTMRLNLRGEILGGGAGWGGTVKPDSPLQLFSIALTTDIDRDVVEPSVSARALYRYNQFLYGTAGAITAATLSGAASATAFNAVVDIPFVDPLLRIPMDTVLDTRRYNAVTLTVTTGVLTDIVDSPVAYTLQNCFVDIEIVRVSPRVPMPLTVAKALPFFKRHAPIVPAGDTIINLDRVPTLAIKRLCAFTSNAAAGVNAPVVGVPFTGLGVNTMLAGLRVSSNFRDHFGSSLGGVNPVLIQAGNKLDYSIEAWPAGWYVVDFNLERSLWNSLATGDKSTLQAIYTWNAGLANVLQSSLLVAGIQKLRNAAGA